MNKSETIGKLTSALIKAKKEFPTLIKSDSIEFAGKPIKYIDLFDTIQVTQNILGAHGLCVYQPSIPDEGHVLVETLLVHESGEWISSQTKMPLDKGARNAAQHYGGMLTYARRYGYMGMLCLAALDDTDGHHQNTLDLNLIKNIITKQTSLDELRGVMNALKETYPSLKMEVVELCKERAGTLKPNVPELEDANH